MKYMNTGMATNYKCPYCIEFQVGLISDNTLAFKVWVWVGHSPTQMRETLYTYQHLIRIVLGNHNDPGSWITYVDPWFYYKHSIMPSTHASSKKR